MKENCIIWLCHFWFRMVSLVVQQLSFFSSLLVTILFITRAFLNLVQVASSSWGCSSWGHWFHGWYAIDLIHCHVQKPIHALQGVAPFVSWPYWSGGPFLGNNLCSICRACYPSLAIGCCWGSFGIYGGQHILWCLCWSGSLSGTLLTL